MSERTGRTKLFIIEDTLKEERQILEGAVAKAAGANLTRRLQTSAQPPVPEAITYPAARAAFMLEPCVHALVIRFQVIEVTPR